MDNLFIWIIIRKLRFPILIIIITFSIAILGMVLIPGMDDQGKVYHLSIFDAFYFVSYMASTIGFGESPYSFTYPQKLWVSFSVYTSVIGWFYGIGAIVSLMQDKIFALEIARTRFIRSINNFKEPFILIFGYNITTKKLIKKLNQEDRRIVVVDKDQNKIEALALENHNPHVPGFIADALDAKILEIAGIKSPQCQAVIVAFENDSKNTTIAMKCRYLNKNISFYIRSSSDVNNLYLQSLGFQYIENPFSVISKRFELALRAPHAWLLESWIYGKSLKNQINDNIPDGKIIVYGYGRMGKALEEGLEKTDRRYIFIDSKEIFDDKISLEVHANEIIEQELLNAGLKKASVIIATSADDMVNLSIITIARKYNPKIYTIARENDLKDLEMFHAVHVDRNYLLEDIITNKIYINIALPLASIFLEHLYRKEDSWGKKLLERIFSKIGDSPDLHEVEISKRETLALFDILKKKERIKLNILKRSRENYKKSNALLFLMIKRGDKNIILPNDNFEVKIGDKLLVACTKESKVDFMYIVDNFYDLFYVMHGYEKISGILGLVNTKK